MITASRIEGLLARLCIVAASLLVTCILLELAFSFYLWRVMPEADFRRFASVNQIKARYGDDLFINSGDEDQIKALLFTPHHYMGYALTPNYRSGGNRHNSLGFRGDEIARQKPDGVYRIVAVGGSTTYSMGVVLDYTQSYPHQMGEYLRSLGYDQVEVINAGVGGYSSYQSLLNIQFRVLPLQPDLIVLYQGYNDIHTRFIYPYANYLGDNSGHIAPYIADTVMPPIWEYSTALRILGIHAGLTQSHLAVDWHRHSPAQSSHKDAFQRQWSLGVYPSGIFAEVSAMEMLRQNPPIHFERNLGSMIAMSRFHNVETLLLTFVTSTAFDFPVVASDEYIFALAQHNDITRQLAASAGVALLDLENVFPDQPQLFTDGRHMTPEGNRVRARLIGDFIIDRFLQ